MKNRIYLIVLLFFLSQHTAHASENSFPALNSPRDTFITDILGNNYVPLSLLVPLIGYHKARTYKTLSISQTTLDIFKKLYASPTDIQKTVLGKLSTFLTDRYHYYYTHGFQRRTLSIPTNAACIPMIHLFDNNTLAINTHCGEPVKIWSLHNSSLFFESKHKSQLPSCYFEPSKCLVSLHNMGQAFNILRKSGSDWIDTTTVPIINPHTSIINFIAHNNRLITRNLENDLDMYDIDRLTHMQNYPQAHTDYISCGIQTSEHSFATGSYDSSIKLWDTRTQNPSITIPLSSNAAPYAICAFDSHTLLVGMNQKYALRFIDRRTCKILPMITYDKHPIYDLVPLQNNSVALCANEDVDLADITPTHDVTIQRTIPNLNKPLTIAKSYDNTIAIANIKSIIFFLKPRQPYHVQELSLSNALTCIALYKGATE